MDKHYHVIHGNMEEAGVHPDLFRTEDLSKALSFLFAHAIRYVNNLEEFFPGEALDVRAQVEERFLYSQNPINQIEIESEGIFIYADNNESTMCILPCDVIDCDIPLLKER